MNLGTNAPVVASGAWVAPSAAVIGNVTLGSGSSVWYNSVVKGMLKREMKQCGWNLYPVMFLILVPPLLE